ncbi:hypothetical protein A5656_19700 [Mycobacterium gordonae]|nr:hypothetical protein [Mycobacterium gordonae]OBK56324.1 hypothetical protein A5656_19700 [Mycobacterium gordonae]
MSAVTKARSDLGVKTRKLGPNHPDTIEARRTFRAEQTAAYIEKVLAEAPPLTDQQKARLAELFRPTNATTHGGAA